MATLRSISLALVLVACGGPEPATPAAPPMPNAAPVTSSEPPPPAPVEKKAPAPAEPAPKALEAIPPTVKLLEPGTAPRKALRYAFKTGAPEYVQMDMKMSMGITMGAKSAPKTDLPTVRTTMRLEATEVAPDGQARCTFNTERAEVLKDAQLPASVQANLEKEIAELVGLKGKSRVSSRGVATETEFELAPSAGEKLKARLDSMRDAVRQMYAPLPEEEVGTGAKWEVTSRIPMSGAMMDVKTTYTVTKVAAGKVDANVETSMTAPPHQPMQVAALPPGASAILESLTGSGSGKVSPSLTHLAGTAQNHVTLTTEMSIAAKDEKVPMKVASDIGIDMKPTKAPPAPKK